MGVPDDRVAVQLSQVSAIWRAATTCPDLFDARDDRQRVHGRYEADATGLDPEAVDANTFSMTDNSLHNEAMVSKRYR